MINKNIPTYSYTLQCCYLLTSHKLYRYNWCKFIKDGTHLKCFDLITKKAHYYIITITILISLPLNSMRIHSKSIHREFIPNQYTAHETVYLFYYTYPTNGVYRPNYNSKCWPKSFYFSPQDSIVRMYHQALIFHFLYL